MSQPIKNQNFDPKKHKSLIIFIVVSLFLLAIGAFVLINYQPKTTTEKFYEDRKDVRYYQEYRSSRSNKKKAERNIFLQD